MVSKVGNHLCAKSVLFNQYLLYLGVVKCKNLASVFVMNTVKCVCFALAGEAACFGLVTV
jgi:hypothetical protein